MVYVAKVLEYSKYMLPQALECPFLSGYSDGVMLDIVLTPGEQRLRVLQWILTT